MVDNEKCREPDRMLEQPEEQYSEQVLERGPALGCPWGLMRSAAGLSQGHLQHRKQAVSSMATLQEHVRRQSRAVMHVPRRPARADAAAQASLIQGCCAAQVAASACIAVLLSFVPIIAVELACQLHC